MLNSGRIRGFIGEEAMNGRIAPAGDTARQFMLERKWHGVDAPLSVLPHLPFLCWVTPCVKHNLPCRDCVFIWRFTDESFEEFKHKTGLPLTPNARYVCIHVGHFVE